MHFDQLIANAFGDSDAAHLHGRNEEAHRTNTTVMLRNFPKGFTRSMLLKLIDAEGFDCRYDFAYVPVDFNTGEPLGYGFINLISRDDADEIFEHFNGFSNWEQTSDAVCIATLGEPCQGLAQHIERYRNSPVMHLLVPDEWKPIALVDGVRVQFP